MAVPIQSAETLWVEPSKIAGLHLPGKDDDLVLAGTCSGFPFPVLSSPLQNRCCIIHHRMDCGVSPAHRSRLQRALEPNFGYQNSRYRRTRPDSATWESLKIGSSILAASTKFQSWV